MELFSRPLQKMNLLSPKTILFPNYTKPEELVNGVTSAIGAILSFVGLSVILCSASIKGNVSRGFSLSLFCGVAALLYIASGLYHSFGPGRTKYILRILDHICIYFFVTATYTALALNSLQRGWDWSLFGVRARWGWLFFGAIWGLAALGIVLEFVLKGRLDKLPLLLNGAMSWFIVIGMKAIFANIPEAATVWLFTGMCAYILGFVCLYCCRKMPYYHALWHLFVIAGSICHFFAVLHICIA